MLPLSEPTSAMTIPDRSRFYKQPLPTQEQLDELAKRYASA
jgi:hypothetical protein